MNISAVPFLLLRFQYQVVRIPLQLIEERLIARMDSEAPARLLYERSLGTLDVTVGKALVDPALQHRGAALIERSDALGLAARLDTEAVQHQEQADTELKATREKTIEEQEEARAAKTREVESARNEADEKKRSATEAAKQRTEAAKQRIEADAADRVETAEAAKRRQRASIQASERAATTAAEAKAKDAQAKRAAAKSKRAQADRIEELAEAEQQKRKMNRTN